MHLVETYALACGAKIDKPLIYEKYFPLPAGKYVSFQPFSNAKSKNYDFWQQVIDILFPILSKNEISILQIGARDEKGFRRCLNVTGNTNLGQAMYVIARSELHLGADSFGAHAASSFGKKIVALYANNIVENVRPYWSHDEDVILIEPKRTTKPNFSLEESPKTINSIKPEMIAESVCGLLGLDFQKPYETVFIGEKCGEDDFHVFVPDVFHPVHNPPQPIELRMDYHFDESILERQLNACACAVVTDREINLDLLKKYRSHLAHLFYEVTKDDNPEFAHAARKIGLKIVLMSRLSEEELTDKKINYLDVGQINLVDEPEKKLIKKIKNTPNLFYKSNKIILSNQKKFSSHPKYQQGIPDHGKYEPLDTSGRFFDDLDHYHIVKLLD
jgi:hypothetical protein